jgi:hypothetical protein
MTAMSNGQPRPDRDEYVRNRSQVRPEELVPYLGQWIAWSLDGRRILAHHVDLLEASRQVKTGGFDDEDVNWEHIPESGEVDIL